MKQQSHYFSETFEQSRDRFIGELPFVQRIWRKADLLSYPIGKLEDNNTTDVIRADGQFYKENLIIITTGVHGIEGYAGTALLNYFIEHYLPQLNPNTTGLRLVHAVNPWGMKNRRRFSENNIDLNRNFIKDWNNVPADLNKRFEKEKDLFLPSHPISDLKKQNKQLYKMLLRSFLRQGKTGMETAATMGQYQYPRGIFYGGQDYDEPVSKLLSHMEEWIRPYKNVIFIDIHTGLGPANKLWIQVPDSEPRKEKAMKKQFSSSNVNDVQKTDVKRIKGEDAEYVQDVFSRRFPQKRIFSTLFEFGTLGNSLKDQIKALQTVINENHFYWRGAEKRDDIDKIKQDMDNLFYPEDQEWRDSVLQKGKTAFDLVLEKEAGFTLPENQ